MRLAVEQLETVKAIAATETIAQVLDRKGRTVYFVPPIATVYQALERMAEHQVGALLVMDAEQKLLGVISERDYARKVILQGRSSRDTLVSELMSHPALTAAPATTVREGLEQMTTHRVRHLPVVDPATGAVEGIVSIGDLVRAVIHAQARAVEQLTQYISGAYPL